MGDGCAPGKDCCDDCKQGKPTAEQFPLQQGRDLAAGSCITILQQADEGRDLLIWGPASTEAVSEDAKLVRMDAIEQSLPQAFETGTITFLHKDQNVARLERLHKLDPLAAPPGPARNLALYLQEKYGGAPTAVLPVTEELVQAFPKQLALHKGKRAFFAGALVRGNTETKRFIQDEIRQGRMDSYSISGMPTEIVQRQVCDDNECRTVQEIRRLDLSAVTLGANRDKAGPLSAKVRNPGAAFIMLQQANESPKKTHAGLGGSVDPPAAEQKPVEQAAPAAPPAAPAPPVEQSDANMTPAAPATSTTSPAAPDVVADLLRRVEALEQELGTLRGAQKTPEAPKVDEAYMEQAVKKHYPALEQAAVAKAEAKFQALLAQAKPADTPTPASPADPSKTKEAAILEAARSGDPTKLLGILQGLRAGGAGGGTA